MHNSKLPDIIKVGNWYTTSWANTKYFKYKLIDVTNNKAYLKNKDGNEIQTHVNTLRKPDV